jgi:(2R)-3-sulfolactate dehydrogenase (NADP+)
VSQTVLLSLDAAERLCEAAALRHGASPAAARSLAAATVAAEAQGQPTVGLSHLFDYLDAMEAGRIDGAALPVISRPAPVFIMSDARGGTAHLGFDMVFDALCATARQYGVGLFAQKGAYTCGALGWFTGRLAEAGFVALAATNGPPMLAGSGGTKPVYCTNPLSLAAPVAEGAPLVIDQASSATAFLSIRRAAEEGRPIPEGWALDAEGRPTTDPREAMSGALLAFGGARGANIALMVEVLAAALSGANWSVDAPPLSTGSQCPGTGLFVLAIDPSLLDSGFAARLGAHLDRLSAEYSVHRPGAAGWAARTAAAREGLRLPKALVDRLSGNGT